MKINQSFVELLKELYSENYSEDIENRYNEDVIHEFEKEDDKYYAHLGAIKRKLNNFGKIHNSYLLIDNVVTKERRRQGIFTNLYEKIESKISDADLIYCFPLAYELLFFVDRKNYDIVGQIPIYVKNIDYKSDRLSFPLKMIMKFLMWKNRSRIKIDTSNYHCKKVDSVHPSWEDLFRQLSSNYPLMTFRTYDFLCKKVANRKNYIFLESYNGNELSGYLIAKIIEKTGYKFSVIMDIIASDDESRKVLIDELQKITLEQNGVMVVTFLNDMDKDFFRKEAFAYSKRDVPMIIKSDGLGTKLMEWYVLPIEGEFY